MTVAPARSSELTRREVAFGLSLTGAMLAGGLMPYVLGAAGPYIASDLSLDEFRLGTLTSAFYLVATVGSLVSGAITAHLGARRAVLLLYGLAVVAFALMGIAPAYAVLLIAALAAGLTMALGNPATNELIVRHSTPERRGLLIGVKQSGVQVAALFAGLLVPLVANVSSWRVSVLACAALLLAGLALSRVALPNRPADRQRATGLSNVRYARLWILVAYGVFAGAAYAAIAAYLPLYAVRHVSMSPLVAGELLAALGLVGVASRMMWVRLVERGGRHAVPVSLTLIAVSGVVATLLVESASRIGPWVLWVAVVLFGATIAAWTVVANLAVAIPEAPWSTARASGLVMAGYYGGLLVGPLTFGALVGSDAHFARGWGLSAALFGVSALIAGKWWFKAVHR